LTPHWGQGKVEQQPTHFGFGGLEAFKQVLVDGDGAALPVFSLSGPTFLAADFRHQVLDIGFISPSLSLQVSERPHASPKLAAVEPGRAEPTDG
jgi:hypothetical protein